MPEARSRSRISNSRSASPADSVEVGSSRISTDDFAATARAIAISWRSAGRNSMKSRSSGRSRSSAAAISAARRRMARGVRKAGEAPEHNSSRIRFSATVSPGAPAWLVCWWTVAMPSARAACGEAIDTGLPATSTRPASGCSVPDRIFTSVDLPAPLAPISATISPR